MCNALIYIYIIFNVYIVLYVYIKMCDYYYLCKLQSTTYSIYQAHEPTPIII